MQCPSSTLDPGSTPATTVPHMWLFMLMSNGWVATTSYPAERISRLARAQQEGVLARAASHPGRPDAAARA